MTHNHLKLFLSIRRTDIADSVGFYNSSESPLDFRKCNETIITPRTGSSRQILSFDQEKRDQTSIQGTQKDEKT